MEGVKLTIDLEIEEDGRWIAEALELPGVMAYGQSREEAIANTERLAIEVIADRIAHGELPSCGFSQHWRGSVGPPRAGLQVRLSRPRQIGPRG
jgi:predicted RNase H-like HicB family nuclease